MKLSSELNENQAESQAIFSPSGFLIVFHGREPERTESQFYIHTNIIFQFFLAQTEEFKNQVESPQRRHPFLGSWAPMPTNQPLPSSFHYKTTTQQAELLLTYWRWGKTLLTIPQLPQSLLPTTHMQSEIVINFMNTCKVQNSLLHDALLHKFLIAILLKRKSLASA